MSDLEENIKQLYGNSIRIRVCGILIKDDTVLAANHKGISEVNHYWIPPGGGLEFSESITECLNREFNEETGLEISTEDFFSINEYINPPLHAVELFYKVRYISGNLKKGKDPELNQNQMIKEVRYLKFTEIKEMNENSCHPVLKKIAQEF